MQAITFYSTKRLSWQLFDLILRTWNSSCDKTETPGTSVISLYQPGVWNATPSAWHYKVSLFWYLKNTKSNFTDKIKNAVSQSHIHVYMFFQSYHLNELLIDKWALDWSPQGSPFLPRIECFHMTSRRPYWCPKTMKRRPCWCPKPILWELNSFLMQTLSFVPTICIDAGHVSENTLLTTHVLTFTRLYTLLFCRNAQFSN